MKKLWVYLSLLSLLITQPALASLTSSSRHKLNLSIDRTLDRSIPASRIGEVSAQQTGSMVAPWIAITGWYNPLILIHPDGSRQIEVAQPAADRKTTFTNLKWSPDGKFLAFAETEMESGIATIWLFRPGDESPRKLVENSNSGFDWYPDSSAILYDRYAQQTTQSGRDFSCPSEYPATGPNRYDGLYRHALDAESTNDERVISPTGKYPLLNPEFSPDGEHILFQQHEWDSPRAYYNAWPQYVVSLDEPNQVVKLPDTLDDCAWSQNGQTIACGAWDETCSEANSCPIVLFSTLGEETGRLPAAVRRFDQRPLWSPERDELVFNSSEYRGFADGPCGGFSRPSDSPGDSTVWLYSISTGDAKALIAGSPVAWSPGGANLLVVRDGPDQFYDPAIYITDWQGNEPALLAEGDQAAWQPVRPPEAIQDFRMAPANASKIGEFPVLFKWKAPVNPFQSELPSIEYEIRYSFNELTESNWLTSDLLSTEYTLGAPNETISKTVQLGEELLNKPLFIAIKSRSQYSAWSTLSNIVQYIDSGFRPSRDGFSFSNSDPQWGRYPFDLITFSDYTLEDMYRMFGNSVCYFPVLDASQCIFLPWASTTLADWNYQISKYGHCLGMSTTSMMTMIMPDNLALFDSRAQYLFDNRIALNSIPTRKQISYYAVTQLALPLSFQINNAFNVSTPATFLDALKQGFISGDHNVMNIETTDGRHAVTPIAINFQEGQPTAVYFYDNIYPGELKKIDVDPMVAKWPANEIWSAVPLSLITADLFPPWDVSQIFRVFAPSGTALLENGQGQQIGTVEGRFVNQIPEANAFQFIGGLGVDAEPVYYLPLEGVYSLKLHGNERTNSEPITVSYQSPSSLARIEQIQLDENGMASASLSPNGDSLTIQSRSSQELNITFGTMREGQGTVVSLLNADLEGDHTVEISLPGSNSLRIKHGGSGEYQLKISRSSGDGEVVFETSSITSGVDEIHTIDQLDQMESESSLTLLVDRNGDGRAERRQRLKNLASGTTHFATNVPGVVGGGLLFFLGAAALLLGISRIVRRK